MTLKDKALRIALGEIGVEEHPKGSNSGPRVNEYLKSIGLDGGYPWCMAFVYFCFNEAAKELEIKNPLVKTGGVMAHYRKASNRSKDPEAGDIFIMDYGKGMGHTGIVEWVGHEEIHTIEGNTNDEGSREGYEVCRRVRPKSKILTYLKY